MVVIEVFTLLGRISLEGAGEVENGLENIDDKAGNTSSSFENLMDKTDKLGRGMSKFVTGPLALLAGGVAGIAIEAGNYADQMLDISAATGMATSTLQEYEVMARLAGVSTDALVRGQEMLVRNMTRSEGGSTRLKNALDKLNMSFEELESIAPEDRMMRIVEELGNIEEVGERAEIGMMLFGGAWREIAPLIDGGRESLEQAAEMARETGYVMGQENVTAADNFRRALVSLRVEVIGATRSMASEIIPILNEKLIPLIMEEGVPAFRSLTDEIVDLVGWFAELDPEIQKFLTWATGLLAVAGPLAIVLPQIVTSVKLLAGAAAFLGPYGWLVVGVGVLIAKFTDLDNKLLDVIDKYVEFSRVSKDATEAELVSELADINMEINKKNERLKTASGILASDLRADIGLLEEEKDIIMSLLRDIRKENKKVETETEKAKSGGGGGTETDDDYLNFLSNLNQQIEDFDTEQELSKITEGYKREIEKLKNDRDAKLKLADTFDISTQQRDDLKEKIKEFYANQIAAINRTYSEELKQESLQNAEDYRDQLQLLQKEGLDKELEQLNQWYEDEKEAKKNQTKALEQLDELYWAKREQLMEDYAEKEQRLEDEIMQNRFQMNDISKREYRRYLRERLAEYEEYTDEWTRIRQKIDDTLEADSDPNQFSSNLARLGRMGRNAASGGTEKQEISGFLKGVQQAHAETTAKIQTFWRDTGQLLYNETNNLFANTLKDAENFADHFENFMNNMVDNALNQLARLATNWVFQELGMTVLTGGVAMATGGKVSGPVNAVIGEGKDDEVVMPLNQGVFSNLASSITDEMGDKTVNNQGETRVNIYQIDGANEQATVNGIRKNPEVVKQIVVDSVKYNSEVREMLKRFV